MGHPTKTFLTHFFIIHVKKNKKSAYCISILFLAWDTRPCYYLSCACLMFYQKLSQKVGFDINGKNHGIITWPTVKEEHFFEPIVW